MAFPHLRVITVFILVMLMQSVSAKRGCSAFGHSCFGGHGKRSSDMSAPNNIQVSNSEGFGAQQRQFGQEETPPHPGYPRTEVLPSGDNIIPIRDGGFYEHNDIIPMKEIMNFRLGNIVKRWMDIYRRSQRTPDYGIIVD